MVCPRVGWVLRGYFPQEAILKARKVLIFPAALLLGLVTACGGGGEGGSGSSGSDEPKTLPSSAINAQPRENLQQGGELRIPIEEFGGQWNGMNVEGNLAETSDMLDPLMPKLIVFDDKGQFKANPDYLESVEATEEPPTTVTYNLNPDAKWNSGRPIGLEDFEAMWKACNGENKDFECTTSEGYDQIKSIEQGDSEQQVVVTYKAAYPDWSGTFSGLFPAEGLKDPKTFNEGWRDITKINDWMSGPFKVGKFDETQKILTQVPNDKWWGEKPLLDQITWKVVPSEAQANAFVNGEIDAYDIGVDADSFAKARTVPEGEIRQANGPDYRHFTFNAEAGLLKDKVIRQAIQKSINRTQIANSDLAGLDAPPSIMNNHVFVPGQAGYQDNVKGTDNEYNPEQAKKDLDEAGWKAGSDGIREKDGEKLVVKFSQLDGVAVSENEAIQFQNQMKDIGIKVEIVNTPIAKFQDGSLLNGGEFEVVAFSWLGTPFPYSGIKQIYGTDQSSNFSNYSDPKIDELADQIAVELDPDKRIELANEVDKLMWDNVMTMPLYQRPQNTGAKKNLANWGSFGMQSYDWLSVGYMKE